MTYRMRKPRPVRRGRLLGDDDLRDLRQVVAEVRILADSVVISESGFVTIANDRHWRALGKVSARLWDKYINVETRK